jgi:lycopene beta-cyclase
MGRYEYLLLLAACLLLTAPLELLLGARVYRQLRRAALSIGCMALLFVPWDLAGAWLGHWDYNPARVTGLRVLDLPVEEYLFFVVVPLCALLTYEAVRLTLPTVSATLSRWVGRVDGGEDGGAAA